MLSVPPPPARAGDALLDADTPALILDLDIFERNLAQLARVAESTGVRLRPHAKTHKCVDIARRQIDAGAIGICCQKLAEAEVFIAGGIDDVLITNEVVGDAKLRRLADVARRHPGSRLGVCVDDLENVAQLAAACTATAARVDVYVEIDVGQNRAGVVEAHEALVLARAVLNAPSLRLRGLHAYAGAAQHRRGVPERQMAAHHAAKRAEDIRRALVREGVPIEIVTGGGTGTFVYDATSAVYNEIQPGSYIFMDADYARNAVDPRCPQFGQALFVLATVMSVRGERATLDAGLKTFSTDSGPAQPTFPGWGVRTVSDEHAVLQRDPLDTAATPIRLGDKALLIPGHCDPTVNLHDWIIATRRGEVEALWQIGARGATA